MKLSILDQSPVMSGATSQDAFQASVRLAQLGEELGFTRYWITEHHGMQDLASSVPEVLLAYIANQTKEIKVGTGAILLPHYKPYKVAEIAHTLSTLFPGRIDLGIGRAPGGSAEASIALSGNFLDNVRKFPDLLDELLHFIKDDFPKNHFYSKLHVNPISSEAPDVWLLGTSKKSALVAAEEGIGYAFGHFMSDEDSKEIIQEYIERFKPSSLFQEPYVILAVSAICSETKEDAESIALNMLESNWARMRNDSNNSEDKQEYIRKQRSKLFVGNAKMVNSQLLQLANSHYANEIMVITNTHSYDSRQKSYQLLKTKPTK